MKIAIYGYGNIGRGVECAAAQNPDMTLTGVYTRRDPAQVQTKTGVPVYPASEIGKHKDEIDVLLICGGSATDLPELTPMLARDFNVVDSFDTHARIPEHFASVDAAARGGAIPPSSPGAGTPASSPWRGSTPMPSFPRGATTPSGAGG